MDVDRLNEIIPHLRYEWRQLNDAAKLLADKSSERKTLQRGEWSALVESFVMHTRTLIDVLYRGRTRSTDVDAADFLVDPSCWPAIRGPGNADELTRIVERVNRQVAHLTYHRADYKPSEFLWDIQRVIDLLRGPMEKLDQQTQQEGRIELLSADERVLLQPSQCNLTATTTGAVTPQGKSSLHGRTDI